MITFLTFNKKNRLLNTINENIYIVYSIYTNLYYIVMKCFNFFSPLYTL